MELKKIVQEGDFLTKVMSGINQARFHIKIVVATTRFHVGYHAYSISVECRHGLSGRAEIKT